MTTRREIIGGAAAAGAALAMPNVLRAQARTPLTAMTPFGFIPDFIEMMNAVSGGHFAAQGLDVTLLGGQGTAQAIQQLVAGQVGFIRSAAIDQMRAVSATNAPLVAFSTLYQGSTFYMVSHKDKPIRSAEDLKGKTIGLVSVGGTTDTFVDLILHKAGLAKDDVKREVTGNSPGAFQIMSAGRVDGFMCSTNVLVTLQRMGQPIEAWSTDRYAPMPSQGYVATRAMVEGKPETMIRVMRAMKASIEEVMTTPLKAVYERAMKDFEIPGLKDMDAVVEVQKAAMDKLWLSEGRENLMRNVPRLWASGVEALNGAGLTALKSPESLYTNSYVDAVTRT